MSVGLVDAVDCVSAAGGRGPDELNQVMLPILDRDICNRPNWYDGEIDDSMVCAGYAQGGRDTCQVYSNTHTHTHTVKISVYPWKFCGEFSII